LLRNSTAHQTFACDHSRANNEERNPARNQSAARYHFVFVGWVHDDHLGIAHHSSIKGVSNGGKLQYQLSWLSTPLARWHSRRRQFLWLDIRAMRN
jgi:hypothetical protein